MSAWAVRSGTWALVILALSQAAPARADDNVRVCVLTILATEKDATVADKLDCIAREVRKKSPKLTGFRLAKMSCQALTVGKAVDFHLPEDVVASIIVEKPADADNRVQLKVRPPKMADITYLTGCGKFLPILTPITTKDGDVMIIAVRVTPCHCK